MTQKERAEIIHELTQLGQAFDKPMSEVQQAIYLESLAGFSIDQIKTAVAMAIRTKTFFPKVAELRQLIEGNPDDRAAQAWAAFLEAARQAGQSSVKFLDPATAIAMDAVFGGWTEALKMLAAGWVNASGEAEGGCTDEMLAHYQKSFLRQYQAARNHGKAAETYRAGLYELDLREKGAQWANRRENAIRTQYQPVLFVGREKVQVLLLDFEVAAGRLSDAAIGAIVGGWEPARLYAAQIEQKALPSRPQRSLPPGPDEMPTVEERKRLVAEVLAKFGTKMQMPPAEPEDAQGAEVSPVNSLAVEHSEAVN